MIIVVTTTIRVMLLNLLYVIGDILSCLMHSIMVCCNVVMTLSVVSLLVVSLAYIGNKHVFSLVQYSLTEYSLERTL